MLVLSLIIPKRRETDPPRLNHDPGAVHTCIAYEQRSQNQPIRPNSGPCSTSKHGLWGLTHVTALEGRDFGIACGCLYPGNTMVERRQATGKTEDDEPMMTAAELAQAAVCMAAMPPHVNMLEAIVLPIGQMYVGRG